MVGAEYRYHTSLRALSRCCLDDSEHPERQISGRVARVLEDHHDAGPELARTGLSLKARLEETRALISISQRARSLGSWVHTRALQQSSGGSRTAVEITFRLGRHIMQESCWTRCNQISLFWSKHTCWRPATEPAPRG